MKMNNLFTTYEQSLKLRDLGFDEPCIQYYDNDNRENTFKLFPYFSTIGIRNSERVRNQGFEQTVSAPLYKQAFDLRDKYINKLVKGFDQIIKELDGTEVKHVAPSSGNRDTLQRNQENFRRAQTNAGVTGQQPTPQQAPATESADSKDQPEPADKANDSVDKDIRRLANTMMANFKKSVSISGAVVTHTIKVANAFLSYGEQSLTQYGK